MEPESFEVGTSEAGGRLDKLASRKLGVTRSAAQKFISSGAIVVNGKEAAPSRKIHAGDRISADLPSNELEPEDIPIPTVFEDEHLIVVDKPAGLVVHPGAGNPSGTLANALLEHGISGGDDPSRPGIVHRLDRDTSGLLAVAKGEPAYSKLVEMLSKRKVSRIYRAVVVGTGLPETGTINSPVGRDPDNPTLMAAGVGKNAITHFEVMGKTSGHTMLRVRLETGRTHQIRVHLSAIGYPIYADPLYGAAVENRRLWLHAERLGFEHPVSGEGMEFEAAVPEELRDSVIGLGFSGVWA